MKAVYRYEFLPTVPLDELEGSLALALLAVESIHGESAALLDAGHYLDPDRRACVISTETAVGRDLNKLFIGFLRREFGEAAFKVERLSGEASTTQQEPCAV